MCCFKRSVCAVQISFFHKQASLEYETDSSINSPAYAALYVYHDQVAALLGGEVKNATSIEIFAKSVGARQQTEFRRLITKGHSPSTKIRNPRTNTEQLYISLSDAEAFHAKFYTLRIVSSKFGRSWQRLSAELAAASVKPFSPDGKNYGNIYLKSEVDHCLE